MSRLKNLARREHGLPPLAGGHSLCQGCGIPAVVRTVLDTFEQPVVVVNATGCLEVATTRFPTTAWNVPWMHVAFENAAAVASGVEAAQRALRRRNALPHGEEVAVVVFAGDGGTYDIGLQALSGALERGHRFLFVCYDNEAYMNTGIQRSGATPFGAATTTSPAGAVSFGKVQQRKDLTAIAAAHCIASEGSEDVSIGKNDVAGIQQRPNLSFISVCEIRAMNQGERCRRQELTLLSFSRCLLYDCRRVPFRKKNFVTVQFKPAFEQIHLRRFA